MVAAADLRPCADLRLGSDDQHKATTVEQSKMATMEVRPFDESDEPNVVALWSEVFGYTEPRNNPTSVIRQKLALQRDLFFVAVLDGTLVGTVMGGYDGHRGWIYSLAVSPTFRQRGIGRSMVQHVERELKQLGLSQDQSASSRVKRPDSRLLFKTRLPRRGARQHGQGAGIKTSCSNDVTRNAECPAPRHRSAGIR